MDIGKRFAQASALTATLAMAAIVGNAQANPLPPKSVAAARARWPRPRPSRRPPCRRSSTASRRTCSRAATADWISGEVWVESSFDTDGDGKLDRLHADYTLPKETATDGLKVPVIYEDSPYYGGTASSYSNWVVDHELGAQPPTRPFAPFFNGTQHEPDDQHRSTSRPWLPRGFAVVHSESPGTGYSDGCPTSGGRNETLGATNVIDWLNGRRKAYTTRTGDVEAPAGQLAQRPHGDDGHVLQRHDPGGRGHHRRPAASTRSSRSRRSPTGTTTTAPTAWSARRTPPPAAPATTRYLGEDLDVLVDDVYSRRDENPPGRAHLPPADAPTSASRRTA